MEPPCNGHAVAVGEHMRGRAGDCSQTGSNPGRLGDCPLVESRLLLLNCSLLSGPARRYSVTRDWISPVLNLSCLRPRPRSLLDASLKYWDKMSIDLRPIYTAHTPTEARRRYEEFTEKWGRAYPAIKPAVA